MPRRIHTPVLAVGEMDLAPAQAHYLRDVLRLGPGDTVEAFDDAGATAVATIVAAEGRTVRLRVTQVIPPATAAAVVWSVAAAVPKGARADWMIEKLAELGAAEFIPLTTGRSVSHPGGTEKRDRWLRLAAEASRQSRRVGVMRIWPMTTLDKLLAEHAAGVAVWHLSLESDAVAIATLTVGPLPGALLLLIGPEGGWTEGELAQFRSAGSTAVQLTSTTLRVETAAIAAAAVVAVHGGGRVVK